MKGKDMKNWLFVLTFVLTISSSVFADEMIDFTPVAEEEITCLAVCHDVWRTQIIQGTDLLKLSDWMNSLKPRHAKMVKFIELDEKKQDGTTQRVLAILYPEEICACKSKD